MIKWILAVNLVISAIAPANYIKKQPILQSTPIVEDFPTCNLKHETYMLVPESQNFNSRIEITSVQEGKMNEGDRILISDGAHLFVIWLECK